MKREREISRSSVFSMRDVSCDNVYRTRLFNDFKVLSSFKMWQ